MKRYSNSCFKHIPYPQITDVTVRRQRRLPVILASSTLNQDKAAAFSSAPSTSFIIYRRSVPCQRHPLLTQGHSLSDEQWTVDREVAVDSL